MPLRLSLMCIGNESHCTVMFAGVLTLAFKAKIKCKRGSHRFTKLLSTRSEQGGGFIIVEEFQNVLKRQMSNFPKKSLSSFLVQTSLYGVSSCMSFCFHQDLWGETVHDIYHFNGMAKSD